MSFWLGFNPFKTEAVSYRNQSIDWQVNQWTDFYMITASVWKGLSWVVAAESWLELTETIHWDYFPCHWEKKIPHTENWRPCQDTFWNRFVSGLQVEGLFRHIVHLFYISILFIQTLLWIHVIIFRVTGKKTFSTSI